MNKERNKELENIIAKLKQLQRGFSDFVSRIKLIKSEIDTVKAEEEEAHNNLPQHIQEGMKGEKMQSIMDSMESVSIINKDTMKKQLMQKTEELFSLRNELKELWMEYVKLEGEVPLGGAFLTMWDGSGERMDKMFYRDGEVFIKDVFGNEYDFNSDTDFESLVDLYDIILTKQSSEEYE